MTTETTSFKIADRKLKDLLERLRRRNVCGCCTARALLWCGAELMEDTAGTEESDRDARGASRRVAHGASGAVIAGDAVDGGALDQMRLASEACRCSVLSIKRTSRAEAGAAGSNDMMSKATTTNPA